MPDQRTHMIRQLEPVKVKKELEDYASMIKVCRADPSFAKERATQSWRTRVPLQILEELEKISGWERSEDEQCFKVSMSNRHDDLVLWDETPAACFLYENHSYQYHVFWFGIHATPMHAFRPLT